MTERCACGSGDVYDACCGPIHEGSPAPSAEALMRSRYTAFAREDAGYLLASWHPSTRPRSVGFDGRRWTRLEIVAVEGGGPFDETGTVEFRAHYRVGAGRGVQRERSRFVRAGRGWSYPGG